MRLWLTQLIKDMELRLCTSVRRLKTVDTYQLRTAITTVPCLASGMAKISRFDVSLYKVRAGKDAELCPATIRYKRCKSDVCTAYVTKAAVSTVSVNTGKDTGDAYDTYRIEALIDNKLVAELSIPVTLDGVRGNTGPLVFPAGIYDSKTRYTCTDKYTVMVLDGENYYVLELKGTVVGLDPSDDYATNGAEAHWQFVEKVEYAFFNVVMANFAKLASAVFHGDYMFSQQGVDASGKVTNNFLEFGTDAFTPNLLLDFKSGNCDLVGSIRRGMKVYELGNVFQVTPKSNIYVIKNNQALNKIVLFFSPGIKAFGLEFTIINGGNGIVSIAYAIGNPFLFKGEEYGVIKLSKAGDIAELIYSPVASNILPEMGNTAFIIKNKSDFKANADGITLDSI